MQANPVEEHIAQAQQLVARGDAAAAAALCDSSLNGTDTPPKLRCELLYIKAVACRLQGRSDEAAEALDAINLMQPASGRVEQERALAALAAGDGEAALNRLVLATRYNPALLQSWRKREALHRHFNHDAGLALCREEISRLEALPPELLTAKNLYHEEAHLKAEAVCKNFMQAHPQHVDGMRILADIAAALGASEEAEFLLSSAVAFAPDAPHLRVDYISALKKRQKFDLAFKQATELLDKWPDRVLHKSIFAIECMQVGEHERACALFDEILQDLPDDPTTYVSKGHALRVLGKDAEAVAAYRKATDINPAMGDAWFSLGNLKTVTFEAADTDTMEALLQRDGLAFSDRIHIHFALGKAYEDAAAFDRAFAHYEAGNECKKRQIGYTAAAMQAELARQREVCTAELFAKQGGKGHDAPDPIFIVGLPRAGSTLIEQILASHSQIDGTLELPNILSLAHKLRGRSAGDSAYPRVLHELPQDELAALGRAFIDETRMHRQGAAFFTDKMPNNFRHIGLIHLILPNAKIIDARRNPMDCCFSGFKQLFAQGQEFTYGLEEIGRYYADYVQLMEHWHAVLPGKILHVQHEDVLDDLEGQVRRMLDYLGLPFEQGCIDFHRTERLVRTASSSQVRQPLNRKGVDAWRPFEAWLDPLKQALGPHAPPSSATAATQDA